VVKVTAKSSLECSQLTLAGLCPDRFPHPDICPYRQKDGTCSRIKVEVGGE